MKIQTFNKRQKNVINEFKGIHIIDLTSGTVYPSRVPEFTSGVFQ